MRGDCAPGARPDQAPRARAEHTCGHATRVRAMQTKLCCSVTKKIGWVWMGGCRGDSLRCAIAAGEDCVGGQRPCEQRVHRLGPHDEHIAVEDNDAVVPATCMPRVTKGWRGEGGIACFTDGCEHVTWSRAVRRGVYSSIPNGATFKV